MRRAICISVWTLTTFALGLICVGTLLSMFGRFIPFTQSPAIVNLPSLAIFFPSVPAVIALWLGIRGLLPGTRKMPLSS